MNRFSKLALLATVISAAGTVAYATQSAPENDAMAVSNAHISLVQAVTTAEQHVNGKAARAEYEHTKQGWTYDVEVVSGGKVFDVKVDADKGTVISSAQDRADRDDGQDKQD
jgi:uncharacterized membrane protein YkoI